MALPCNHILCGQCTLAAAGHAGTRASVRDLAKLRAQPGAACPTCHERYHDAAMKGFFQAAQSLPHVGQLVQTRSVLRLLWPPSADAVLYRTGASCASRQPGRMADMIIHAELCVGGADLMRKAEVFAVKCDACVLLGLER